MYSKKKNDDDKKKKRKNRWIKIHSRIEKKMK